MAGKAQKVKAYKKPESSLTGGGGGIHKMKAYKKAENSLGGGGAHKMKVCKKVESSIVVGGGGVTNKRRRESWEDEATGSYYRFNTGEKSGSGEYRKYTNISVGNKSTGHSAKYYTEEKYPEGFAKYLAEEKYPQDSSKYYPEEKYHTVEASVGGFYSVKYKK